jgi:hypothetical protein
LINLKAAIKIRKKKKEEREKCFASYRKMSILVMMKRITLISIIMEKNHHQNS